MWLGFYTTFLLMIRNTALRLMSDRALNNFLKKIEQLNQIVNLIKNNPQKKNLLSNCKSHEEVIKLKSEWGFKIGKNWG